MEDCLFCKIGRHEIGELIWEDDRAAAFNDLHPMAPIHILIIPKAHVESLNTLEDAELGGYLMQVTARLAKDKGVDKGYKVVINTGSTGHIGHLHLHLLAGKKFDSDQP